jgi:spore coat protein U-like protein
MNRFALLALALLLAPLAHAGQTSATMQVSARVVASCAVSADDLRFPDYTSGGPAVHQNADVRLRCTKGAPATVYVDGPQVLTSKDGTPLAYAVHTPAGAPWTSTAGVAVLGQGIAPVALPLAGTIAAGQRVAPGDYQGEVLVRVVY